MGIAVLAVYGADSSQGTPGLSRFMSVSRGIHPPIGVTDDYPINTARFINAPIIARLQVAALNVAARFIAPAASLRSRTVHLADQASFK